MTDAELVVQGQNLILEKMKRDRPTLKAYLRSRAMGEAESSSQWNAQSPGCDMSIWRAGASYAYRDIERMIENNGFSPETT